MLHSKFTSGEDGEDLPPSLPFPFPAWSSSCDGKQEVTPPKVYETARKKISRGASFAYPIARRCRGVEMSLTSL